MSTDEAATFLHQRTYQWPVYFEDVGHFANRGEWDKVIEKKNELRTHWLLNLQPAWAIWCASKGIKWGGSVEPAIYKVLQRFSCSVGAHACYIDGVESLPDTEDILENRKADLEAALQEAAKCDSDEHVVYVPPTAEEELRAALSWE